MAHLEPLVAAVAWGTSLAAAAVAVRERVGLARWVSEAPPRLGARLARWRRSLRVAPAGAGAAELLIIGLAAQLRAGATLPQALRALAQDSGEALAPVLAAALTRAERGDWVGALEQLSTGLHPRERLHLAAAVEVCRRTGGNLAPVLERVGETMRETALRTEEVRARTAEARWSAAILALTSPAMLVYVGVTHPTLLETLLTTGVGAASTVYAVASWLGGIALMRRLLARAADPEGEG